MLKNDHYTYRVTWSEEDGEYIGLCAEFPSLSWLASEPETALHGIRQVVADVVKDLQTQESQFQSRWPLKNIVDASWYVSPRSFTDVWLWKQQNRGLA
jgi:hypothetical protein